MSDALSKFIGGLQSLDPQAAFANFKGLDAGTQGQVLTDLTGKYGTSFDELNGLSDADKARVTQNIKDGKGTFDGVTRTQQAQTPAQQQPAQQQAAQPEKPKTFEQAWAQAAEQRNNGSAPYHPSQDTNFAKQHGAEAARTRHGYVSPERQAQLDRIASMQSEAKRTGKTFSEVADARVANGQ